MTTATSFADAPGQGADVSRNVNVDFTSDVSGFTQGVNQATAAVQQLSGALTGAVHQADSLSKMAGKTLAHFTVGDFASLGVATGIAARFEHQMSSLASTATVTGASMNQMKSQLTGVFNQFPVWREQVVALATAINNMGVSRPSDVGKLTASYIKLGAATGEDPTALAASGIGLAKQMGNLDATKIDKFNDSLFTLSKTAGVSAQSITDFGSALAPFAKMAGATETQVLGISTAFQKAGADGMVAANAFSNLLSTITQLKATGGNAAQFSGFLGQSQAQFLAQTPLESATRITERLGQGGPAASLFAQQNLGGIRAQGAFARVAQTGGLRDLQSLSESAYGSGSSTKGAEAAFGGLTNSMTTLRNQFTQLGEIIGGPLLTPLKALADVAGKLVGAFNTVAKVAGPVLPGIGVAAGVAGVTGAFGLAHLAAGQVIGLGRSTMGRNAPWRQRLSARMAASPRASRFQQAYRQGRSGMAGAAGRGFNWWMTGTNQPMQQSYQSAGTRQRNRGQPYGPQTGSYWSRGWRQVRQMPYRSGRAVLSGGAAAARAARRRLPITPRGIVGRTALTGVSAAGRLGSGLTAAGGAISSVLTNPLAMMGIVAGGTLINSLISSAQARRDQHEAQISGSTGAQATMDEALGKTSSNLANFSDAVNNAADTLVARFGSKSLTQTAQVTSEDVSTVQSKDFKSADQGLTDLVAQTNKMAPDQQKKLITSYLLAQGLQSPDMMGDQGTAEKQAALKGAGVDRSDFITGIFQDFAKAQKAPGGFAAAGFNPDTLATYAATVPGPLGVTLRGQALAGLQAATQPSGAMGVLPNVAGQLRIGAESIGTNDINQGQRLDDFVDWMSKTYNIDPREFKADIFQVAAKQKTAVKPNYGSYAAGQSTVTAPFTTAAQGMDVLGQAFAMTGAGKQKLAASGLVPGQLFAAISGGSGSAIPPAASNQDLTALAGMGPLGKLLSQSGAIGAAVAKPTDLGLQQAAINAAVLAAYKGGGPGGTTAGPGEAAAALLAIANQTTGALHDLTTSAAAAATTLDGIAAVDLSPGQQNVAAAQAAQVASVAGAQPLATPEQQKAAADAPQQAASAVSSQIQIDRQRMQALVAYNTQAQGLHDDYITQTGYTNLAFNNQQARAQVQYNTSVMRTNREFGLQTQRADVQNQLQRTRSTEDFNTQQGRATKQYELGRSREIIAANLQVTRATQDFHTNQQRETQDYQTSTERSNQAYNLGVAREEEDFHTSQLRATEDYNTARTRQLEDYHTQVQRATRDFNTQQARAAQDFNTQMARQAEQEAQNVYDPWTRIQRKATSSAGGLLKNLTQQNASLARQIAELAQAKQLGLSEQTIQQLDLANPANAQQLDTLIKTLKRNPSQAGQINQQVAQRVTNTKSLTQTTDSLSYKNALEDFQKQSSRATQDFQKSMSDGAADLTKSLTRNYDDFEKQTTRAQQDNDKQLKRGAQDHQIALTQAEEDFKKNMSRETTDFDKTLLRDSQDLQTSLKNEAIDFNTQMANSQADFDKQMARTQADFETAQANAKIDHANTLSDMKVDFTTTMQNAVTDHGIALSQMTDQYKLAQERAGQDLQTSFTDYTGGLNSTIVQMTSVATEWMKTYGGQATQLYLNEVINSLAVAAAAAGLAVPPSTTAGSTNANTGQGPPGYNHPVPASASGGTGTGAAGSAVQPGQTTPGGPSGHAHYATGGISLNAQMALVSEAGPELHLPLNSTGEAFMVKLMSRAVADVAKASKPPPGLAGSQFAPISKFSSDDRAFFTDLMTQTSRAEQTAIVNTGKATIAAEHQNQAALANAIVKSIAVVVQAVKQESVDTMQMIQKTDASVNFAGAEIKIVAQDVNAMAKQLQAKAKLAKLTNPKK